MFRKISIAAMLTLLTLVVAIGIGGIEQKLIPNPHCWGYVQQTRVVQG